LFLTSSRSSVPCLETPVKAQKKPASRTRRRLFHLIQFKDHQRQQRISRPNSKPRLCAIRFREIVFPLASKADIEVSNSLIKSRRCS